MRTRTFILIFTLWSSQIEAQLHHDATTLQSALNAMPVPSLDLSKVKNKRKLEISFQNVSLQQTGETLPLRQIGTYWIRGMEIKDTLVLQYGETERLITHVNQNVISIENWPSDVRLKEQVNERELFINEQIPPFNGNTELGDQLTIEVEAGKVGALRAYYAKVRHDGKEYDPLQREGQQLVWKNFTAPRMIISTSEEVRIKVVWQETEFQFLLHPDHLFYCVPHYFGQKTLLFSWYLPQGDAKRQGELDAIVQPANRLVDYRSAATDYIEKEEYLNVLSLLATHAEFKDSSLFSEEKYFKLNNLYLDNPFLNKNLSDLLLKNSNKALGNEKLDLLNQKIKIHSSNYPWQDRLYFPEKEAEGIGESYQEIIASYREPVDVNAVDQLSRITESTLPGRASGLDVTTFIAGLSDFIVKRAQEEFNITFLENFIEQLEKDTTGLLIFFPNTLKLIRQFELGDYKSMLESARPAFHKDLNNLAVNMSRLLRTPDFQKKMQYSPEVYNMAMIYHIADMAYRDIGVEEIMINVYRQLDLRLESLNKEINLDIARNSKAGDFFHLRAAVNQYCRDLENLFTNLGNVSRPLDMFYVLFNVDYVSEKIAEENKNAILSFESSLVSNRNLLSARMGWTDKTIYKAYDVKDESFSYYRNFVINNLNGNPYYGYTDSKKLSMDAFEEVFGEEKDSIVLLATGLELSRDMILKDYPSFFENQVEILNRIYDEANGLWNMLAATALNLEARDVKTLQESSQNLDKFLDAEIAFWEEAFQLNKDTDRELAGLYFLKKETTRLLDEEDPLEKINRAWDHAEEVLRKLEERFKDPQVSYTSRMSQNPYSKRLKPEGNFNNSKVMQSNLAEMKEGIAALENSIRKLRGSEADVLKKLTSLEQDKSTKLLHAKRNSESLLKAIEFTLHFLYAFDEAGGDSLNFKQKVNLTDTLVVNIEEPQLEGKRSYQILESKSDTIDIFSKVNLYQWLDRESYQNRMADPQWRNIFLGLLYQKLNAISDQKISQKAIEVMVDRFANLVFEIRWNRQNFALKKHYGLKPGYEDYYPFVKMSVDLMNIVIASPIFDHREESDRERSLQLVPELSDQALSLYENLYAGHYNYALSNTVRILNIIVEAPQDEDKEKSKLIKEILRYGTFVASVLEAQTPQHVEAALRAVTLPKGSSRIKRENRQNVSINAYVAPFAGVEQLDEAGSSATAGLSVPIGVAYSWKGKQQDKGSFSLFGSLLDIGAVTAFRFDNKNISAFPEPLEFRNYIAPGLFFYWNHKSSTSLSLGLQYGPQVRKITENDIESNAGGFRIMLNFGFDAPMFNLYTDPR